MGRVPNPQNQCSIVALGLGGLSRLSVLAELFGKEESRIGDTVFWVVWFNGESDGTSNARIAVLD
jgi:hypothetical protein